MNSYKRLDDYIQLVDNRNKDLAVTNLFGVSIQKKFIPYKANQAGLDLSKYKVIKKNQFAYNRRTSRNGEKIPVALLKDDNEAIVTLDYIVFEVKDEKELIPEYLFIWFNRPESDRYVRFHSWGSSTEFFNWDNMREVRLPIPNINEQKKYVALYKGILNNQRVYENSLEDLQLICDTYMDTLKNIENQQPLRELIDSVDNRNLDGKVKNLLGINVKKEFMPSKANISSNSLLKYKVIEKYIFATNIMHVGRDELLPVALYSNKELALVSPAYKCFKVKENVDLISEFLMLWFYRFEFNRMTWYYCDSSVRGGLDWNRFLDIEIPIPNIKIQEAIVTIYHTLETRKRINEQLKASIKPLCPVLMRGVVEKINKKQEVT